MLLMLVIPTIPVRAVGPYFVTPTGTGTCTQASPCSLSTGLALAVEGDVIYAGAGVYTVSSGNEVVLLNKPVYLYGGWNGASSGAIIRDHNTYISIIDGQNLRRGMTINYTPSLTFQPVVEGWTIRNGNATGLTDYCEVWAFESDGCGGGIYVNGADPMIVRNIIHSNSAAATGSGRGGGGGIYLLESNGSLIFDNQVYNNTSNSVGEGWGGGIYIHESGDETILDDNDVYDNDISSNDTPHYGSGVMLAMNTGPIDVINNRIHDNGQNSTFYEGVAIGCQYCTNQVTIQSNQLLDNEGNSAVALGYSSPWVQQNTIINPGAITGIFFGSSTAGQTLNLFNNIIARHDYYNIYGIIASTGSTTVTMMHNTLADASIGMHLQSSSGLGSFTITFTNGIVSGHSETGISSSGPLTLVVSDTLFNDNLADGVTGTNPLAGNPNFKSPINYNYHLNRGSQAIDRIASGHGLDIDGDTRPFGIGGTRFDAGADEFIHSFFFFLPLTMR